MLNQTEEEQVIKITIEEAQNDKQKLDLFVKQNYGLVRSICRKYFRTYYDSQEQEDILQIGAMGMVRAIKKFNLELDVKFSTYAVPMIIGEIRRFLRDDNSGILKVSRQTKQIWNKYKAMINQGYEEYEIQNILQISGEELREIKNVMQSVLYISDLKTENYNGDKAADPYELLPSSYCLEHELVDDIEFQDKLSLLIEVFPKCADIIKARMCGETQTQLAINMGVSQVHISRIERKAEAIIKECINPYYDGLISYNEMLVKSKKLDIDKRNRTKGENKLKKTKDKRKYKDHVEALKKWAKSNPDNFVDHKKIFVANGLPDLAWGYLQSLTNQATSDLEEEGYNVVLEGARFKITFTEVQEAEVTTSNETMIIDTIEPPTETFIKEIKPFLLDVSAGFSVGHEKIINAVDLAKKEIIDTVKNYTITNKDHQVADDKLYMINLKDTLMSPESMDITLNMIKGIIELAKAQGMDIEATIQMNLINKIE